jgi:hypothetical protein
MSVYTRKVRTLSKTPSGTALKIQGKETPELLFVRRTFVVWEHSRDMRDRWRKIRNRAEKRAQPYLMLRITPVPGSGMGANDKGFYNTRAYSVSGPLADVESILACSCVKEIIHGEISVPRMLGPSKYECAPAPPPKHTRKPDCPDEVGWYDEKEDAAVNRAKERQLREACGTSSSPFQAVNVKFGPRAGKGPKPPLDRSHEQPASPNKGFIPADRCPPAVGIPGEPPPPKVEPTYKAADASYLAEALAVDGSCEGYDVCPVGTPLIPHGELQFARFPRFTGGEGI